MGDGEHLDQFSHAVGKFEATIEGLTGWLKSVVEKLDGVAVAVHLHGERLDKVEEVTAVLHEHHTGKTAVRRFIKGALSTVFNLVPWATLGSLAAYAYANWKWLVSLMH